MKVAKLEDENARYAGEVSKLKEDYEKIQKENADLKRVCLEMDKQLQIVSGPAEEIGKKMKELEEEKKKYSEERKKMMELSKDLEEHDYYEECVKECKALKEACDQKDEVIADLKKKMSVEVEALKERMEAFSARTEERLAEELRSKIEAEKHKTEEQMEFAEKFAAGKTEMLEQKINQQAVIIAHLRQGNDRLLEQLRTYQEDEEKRVDEVLEFKKEIEEKHRKVCLSNNKKCGLFIVNHVLFCYR